MRKVTVPEGCRGEWRVERFEITEEQAKFENLRSMFKPGNGGRSYKAGVYTRLMRGDTVVMSDTPAEMFDHSFFVHQARGDVLINGLGLGMVLQAVLDKPDITSVTVIEASEDVIALVAQHYTDPRVTIIHADAFAYQPPKGKRFGAVWHDIWDHICSENLKAMTKLHRKYGRRTDWQGSWCRELCEID